MRGGVFSQSTRRRIIDRDDGCCVACGKVITGDFSIQHRKARGMGGTRRQMTPADGILMCGTATTGCHGLAEARPEWALQYGYRVPQHGDVLTEPVWVHGYGWRLLTPDGRYAPVEVPA